MLIVLTLVTAGLAALGSVAAVFPKRAAILNAVCGACSAIGALAALAWLLVRAGPELIILPIGPPGGQLALELDPLSGFFLLILFAPATASALYAIDLYSPEEARAAPFFPVFIAAMALTLLAADAFGLVLGFELMSLASWAMVLARHEDAEPRACAILYIGMAGFGAACLIPAFALLAPAGDLRFAAMRLVPAEGWRASAALALVLLGAGSKAGLVPLHVWLPLAHPVAPSHVSALMSGAMTKVALYVIVRVLFDLCGPAQPVWWGVPLLIMGAASAVLGGLRANTEADIKTVLAASTIEHVGFIAIGLGLALMARGADLASLAALALGAAMLHALNHSVFKSLLFLVAGNVQHGAGSRALARLGGLVQRMPVTTAGALAGCAASAGLPLTSGFASEWLLFQTAFASPRVGGLALQSLIAVVVALMALAAALAAAASVRMIGVAFLGRPRTPRGSAAEEAGWPARRAVVGLAVVSGILGLAPGLALSLTQAALHALTGSGITGRAGWLGVAPVAGTPGYAPALLLLLLGLVGAGLFFVLRRWTVGGSRTSAAWQCGFAPPPPWLPFGDPATQYSGASFSQPLLRTLGARIMGYKEEADIPEPGDTRPATLALTSEDPAWPAIFFPVLKVRAWLSGQADRLQYLTIRRALVVMFAALVAFLVAITWLEAL